jgi:thioredoxin reductase (NADPH)
MSRTEEFELIIVGGGPAGLCAAMYAGRGMLRTVLLERGVPGGELLNTEWIDDYPGFEHVLGRELAHRMAAHAQTFGADIRQENVESIVRRDDGIFEVATSGGTTYEAPAVILTAGGTPNRLDVPGEQEYAGRGVSYCAVCDGAFFKGETIAVVGGGDAAVEEADYLTRYAEKVYVIHRRDEFRASKILQERLFANPKIEVIWNRRVLELAGGPAGLERIETEDTVTGERHTVRATGCFIFVGFRPNSGLVKQHFAHDANRPGMDVIMRSSVIR